MDAGRRRETRAARRTERKEVENGGRFARKVPRSVQRSMERNQTRKVSEDGQMDRRRSPAIGTHRLPNDPRKKNHPRSNTRRRGGHHETPAARHQLEPSFRKARLPKQPTVLPKVVRHERNHRCSGTLGNRERSGNAREPGAVGSGGRVRSTVGYTCGERLLHRCKEALEALATADTTMHQAIIISSRTGSVPPCGPQNASSEKRKKHCGIGAKQLERRLKTTTGFGNKEKVPVSNSQHRFFWLSSSSKLQQGIDAIHRAVAGRSGFLPYAQEPNESLGFKERETAQTVGLPVACILTLAQRQCFPA